MGTSQGLDGLAKKLGGVAVALAAADWALDAHRAIARAAKPVAARHGGVMHPWSKGKAARRSVKLAWDKSTADSMQLRPRQPGLWAIREDGAKGHTIPKRRSKAGKLKKRGKVLTIGGGSAVSASHPGAPAEHRWTKVADEVQHDAPRIVADHVHRTLANAFAGGA